MANGKIRFGKQSGGQLALVIPDGVGNTEVTFPESGELAKTSDINTAGVELKTIAIGTATFTATTNNINLTGIGVGVEIGDVIQISGAEDIKNNSEFTVEVITDVNNIIVNQAHANKGTSKNVANRASDTGVTVKLLSKYYNAPLGLGQDWVDLTSSRLASTTYTNNTKRPISASVVIDNSDTSLYVTVLQVNNNTVEYIEVLYGLAISLSAIIPNDSNYKILHTTLTGQSIRAWNELR